MTSKTIVPVLLCGGSGTRLWPVSRDSYPKQFVPLLGDRSLFQSAALRLSGTTESLQLAAPLIVTSCRSRFIVTEQLAAVGIDPGPILIEPMGKDTAPAILAAALLAAAENPETVLLIAPSDHVIPDTAEFHAAVSRGMSAVDAGRIVTFGITPTEAGSAYGYLKRGPMGEDGTCPVIRFVEKPGVADAAGMVRSGDFLWNAGIFLCRASVLIDAYERNAPDLVTSVASALDQARHDLGFLRLAPDPWSAIEPISIDYAVMEKLDCLSVVPFSGHWSDLGSWDAVWKESRPDASGTVVGDRATAIDCTNTLLRSDDPAVEIVGIGLRDVIAVATGDAVLVADRSRTQEVRAAVATLSTLGAPQASETRRDYRPWGWFERLAMGDAFQVKRIVVHPGAALSLQSHRHRSEHWVVVEGTARATLDGVTRVMAENESIFIPKGSIHRLENPGTAPMVLIEVQTGPYLGEDDIVRYHDDYARLSFAAE